LHLAYLAHQGGGGSRRPDAVDRGAAVVELAAPGLVSPGLRAPVCPPPDGRSPSVRLTRWTARCGAFPRWGVRGRSASAAGPDRCSVTGGLDASGRLPCGEGVE